MGNLVGFGKFGRFLSKFNLKLPAKKSTVAEGGATKTNRDFVFCAAREVVLKFQATSDIKVLDDFLNKVYAQEISASGKRIAVFAEVVLPAYTAVSDDAQYDGASKLYAKILVSDYIYAFSQFIKVDVISRKSDSKYDQMRLFIARAAQIQLMELCEDELAHLVGLEDKLTELRSISPRRFSRKGNLSPAGYRFRRNRLCIDSPFRDYSDASRAIISCLRLGLLSQYKSDHSAYIHMLEEDGVVFSSPGGSEGRWICYAYMYHFGIETFLDSESEALLDQEFVRSFVTRSAPVIFEWHRKNAESAAG